MRQIKTTTSTLIRRAYKNRYGLRVRIAKDGTVNIPHIGEFKLSDFKTERMESGNVRLIIGRHTVFKFSPETR